MYGEDYIVKVLHEHGWFAKRFAASKPWDVFACWDEFPYLIEAKQQELSDAAVEREWRKANDKYREEKEMIAACVVLAFKRNGRWLCAMAPQVHGLKEYVPLSDFAKGCF